MSIRRLVIAVVAVMTMSVVSAQAAELAPFSKEIFKDDFSAATLGKEWKLYKAQSQVVDGVLVGEEEKDGGHAAVHSVTIDPTRDIEFALSFRLAGAKNFSVTFNDSKYKGSHAGHIARVQVTAKSIMLRDEKTGIFKNEIYEMKEKDKATSDMLKTKIANFPVQLSENTWYKLVVRCENDTMIVIIDDKEIGRFASEGIAHETKNKPALVVSGIATHFDNVVFRTP
jgi:hypothetical protein